MQLLKKMRARTLRVSSLMHAGRPPTKTVVLFGSVVCGAAADECPPPPPPPLGPSGFGLAIWKAGLSGPLRLESVGESGFAPNWDPVGESGYGTGNVGERYSA